MAILQVAYLGRPVLREVAGKIKKNEIENPEFQSFLDDLLQSMLFHDGVGLAAPQVFNSTRVVAVWVPPEMDDAKGEGIEPTVFINPELHDSSKEMVNGWEGCLSLRDLRGIVPRHEAVTLRALDRNGTKVEKRIEGFMARVLQHEVDHLDGVLFPDRMQDLSSLGFEKDLVAGQDSTGEE